MHFYTYVTRKKHMKTRLLPEKPLLLKSPKNEYLRLQPLSEKLNVKGADASQIRLYFREKHVGTFLYARNIIYDQERETGSVRFKIITETREDLPPKLKRKLLFMSLKKAKDLSENMSDSDLVISACIARKKDHAQLKRWGVEEWLCTVGEALEVLSSPNAKKVAERIRNKWHGEVENLRDIAARIAGIACQPGKNGQPRHIRINTLQKRFDLPSFPHLEIGELKKLSAVLVKFFKEHPRINVLQEGEPSRLFSMNYSSLGSYNVDKISPFLQSCNEIIVDFDLGGRAKKGYSGMKLIEKANDKSGNETMKEWKMTMTDIHMILDKSFRKPAS